MPDYVHCHYPPFLRYALPTVHLGGTHRETLLKGYLAARDAVADALAASEAIEFHPRDYHTTDDWGAARRERSHHEAALENFLDHLNDHIESLYETAN